jgi:hypothetical protein
MFILHQCDTREVIREVQDKKYQIGIVGPVWMKINWNTKF